MKKLPIFWKLGAAFMIVAVIILVVNYFLVGINDLKPFEILTAFIILLIAFVLSILAAKLTVYLFIGKPVKKLSENMKGLIEKKFDTRADSDINEEFSSLFTTFNDLAEMISSVHRELSKNKDYLEGVVESTTDIIITVNRDGKIQTFNKGAENALGYSRAEVIGKSIKMIWADPAERDKAIERLKYGDNVVNVETQFLTKKGEIRNVLLTFSLLRNSAGDMIGTFGISKDITDEKRLQKKLFQTERFVAVGEVFTGVQHSLKNMLNAIKGGSYMVKVGLEKDDRKIFEEGWEIVQEGVNRMSKMSVDMLKFVKGWVPRFENVDLNFAMSEIDLVIKSSARERGIEFQMEIPDDISTINCDAQMIHTVLMDIISNALDACKMKEYSENEKPKVTVRAYQNIENQNTVIEVKDNGCGMSENTKANIFTPFFSKKMEKGTGLGLAIASRMVNAHHGRIEVVSEPDKGTLFQIVLPIDTNNKK